MQENRHACEMNHEHASMPEALCLDPARKVSSQPMDEDGHARALRGERQGTEDGGRKSLAEKFHGSWQLAYSTARSFLLRQAASSQHSQPKTIACNSIRETSFPRDSFTTLSIIG